MNKHKEVCQRLYNIFKKYNRQDEIRYDAYKIYDLLPNRFYDMTECPDYIINSVWYNNDIFLYTSYENDSYYLISTLNDSYCCSQYAINCFNLYMLTIIYKYEKRNK